MAGGLQDEQTAQAKVTGHCVFLAYSSSLASAAAWPGSVCELKDKKAGSHTSADDL